MRKLTLMIGAAALALAGCHTAHIEVKGDGTWSADIYDNWISREINGFEAEVAEGGKFRAKLSGMKSDVSEQLPAFTREMWAGLGFLGQTLAAMYNPAAATVQQQGTTASVQQQAASAATSACPGGACEDK